MLTIFLIKNKQTSQLTWCHHQVSVAFLQKYIALQAHHDMRFPTQWYFAKSALSYKHKIMTTTEFMQRTSVYLM